MSMRTRWLPGSLIFQTCLSIIHYLLHTPIIRTISYMRAQLWAMVLIIISHLFSLSMWATSISNKCARILLTVSQFIINNSLLAFNHHMEEVKHALAATDLQCLLAAHCHLVGNNFCSISSNCQIIRISVEII